MAEDYVSDQMPARGISVDEVARMLMDFRREMRGAMRVQVRRDVYLEAQAADRARIANLEKAQADQVAERAALRRQNLGVVATAAASLVVSVLLILITLSTARGGT